MKKRFAKYNSYLMITAVFMILTFTLSSAAQKKGGNLLPPFAEDTSINPHDFNDEYYAANGVEPKLIVGRRTGSDYLSVFGLSSNPTHRNVRILVTLPAYNENGEIRFWNPLGEFNVDGFTQDEAGGRAREIAEAYPIYVFLRHDNDKPFAFANNRQAAIIDDSMNYFNGSKTNPLGLRAIMLVDYTKKAFGTKEGVQMMEYMSKKNGYSLENTPLIKSVEDINLLRDGGLVSIVRLPDNTEYGMLYAICPTMENVLKGAIAKDAFLITVLLDGKPLTGEDAFSQQFGCLQKSGEWCTDN
jgi:hypothetical protein